MHIMPNLGFGLTEPPGGNMKTLTVICFSSRTYAHVHAGFSGSISYSIMKPYISVAH